MVRMLEYHEAVEAKEELKKLAGNIASDVYLFGPGLNTAEHDNMVAERVSKNNKVQHLLWIQAEWERIERMEKRNEDLCMKWMKKTKAPEYVAYVYMKHHKGRVDKVIGGSLRKMLDAVSLCCGDNEEEEVDLANPFDLHERQIELDEEFEERRVHESLELARQSINETSMFMGRALRQAKIVLSEKQRELLRCTIWRKEVGEKIGVLEGDSIPSPLPENILREQIKKHFPSTLAELRYHD